MNARKEWLALGIKGRMDANRSISDKTGCHNFLGVKGVRGYGYIKWQGKRWFAHRLAWTLEKGAIPDGMHVLHKCDNPSCFNVEHLFIGTHQDNMTDKVNKGRVGTRPSGAEHSRKMAKLDADKVKLVVDRLLAGASGREVAKEFGIHFGTVSDITNGKTWKHVVPDQTVKLLKMQAHKNKGLSSATNGAKVKLIAGFNRGSSHGRATFTEDQVKQIKISLFADNTYANVLRLAEQYGVSRSAIHHIRAGSRWAHIEAEA